MRSLEYAGSCCKWFCWLMSLSARSAPLGSARTVRPLPGMLQKSHTAIRSCFADATSSPNRCASANGVLKSVYCGFQAIARCVARGLQHVVRAECYSVSRDKAEEDRVRTQVALLTLLILQTDAGPATNIEPLSATRSRQDDSWRRTAAGWEDRRRWFVSSPSQLPRVTAIHPSVIGSLQLLVSLGALIAFPVPQRPLAVAADGARGY